MDKIKAYTGSRGDVAQFVSEKAYRILDVGCSSGAVGDALKQQTSRRYVVGLEGDAQFIEQASQRLDKVIYVDLNRFQLELLKEEEKFDCIIFADVLEHLIEPDRLFRDLVSNYLVNQGNVIVSLPNAAHYLTMLGLIGKRWPLMEEGIFDQTHLRWYALKNIEDMISSAGMSVRYLQRNYRMVHDWQSKKNRWVKLFSRTPLRDYVTYQYVVDAVFSDEN